MPLERCVGGERAVYFMGNAYFFRRRQASMILPKSAPNSWYARMHSLPSTPLTEGHAQF